MDPGQTALLIPVIAIVGGLATTVVKMVLQSNERKMKAQLDAQAAQSRQPAMHVMPRPLDPPEIVAQPEPLPAEMAHVLFLDIVGFSRNPMGEQTRLVGDLRRMVQAVPEFRRNVARKDVITLDTGDGMALVFFRDPLAPVQTAVEVARSVTGYPGLKLRMGVHSGPVSRVTDVNGRENVTGSGINTAQRVMSLGDPGHILLSAASAEVVCEFEAWAGCVRELGDAQAKHGQRVHLYNLVLGEVGNPQPPGSLKQENTLPDVNLLRN